MAWLTMWNVYRVGAIVAAVASVSGCTLEQLRKDPDLVESLQLLSAGHTGCMPQDNQVSLISVRRGGDGLWTATCKGKTYLCSGAAVNATGASSCAPEVK